eukprot:TRINITY_DN28174_c0_g2_i2.p3 TRINITY_DN28174_c0_g2~~TRINITY_DN28174_c0_g2_i2.p3  ORF type:complete len:132 (-),score=32.46 TRINITY_DN28174_c0_g2_i2:381-776(-)
MNYLETLGEGFLRAPFNTTDRVEELLEIITLAMAVDFDAQEVTRTILGLMKQKIDEIIETDGVLGANYISVMLADIIETSEIETTTDIAALGELLQEFMNDVENALALDDAAYLAFLSDTMEKISDRLKTE